MHCIFSFLESKNNSDLGVFRKDKVDTMVLAVAIHPTNKLVAVSYDDGNIRIFRYPCQNSSVRITFSFFFCMFIFFVQTPFIEVSRVGSKATRLAFTKDGKYLIIIDSIIRSILQYRIRYF
jgi:hypothetical protein